MAKRGPKTKAVRSARRAASPPKLPLPPAHLKGEAASAWNHLVRLLAAAGNLEKTDPTLVECYAVNVALLRAAQAAITKDGVTVENGMGAPAAHPAVSVVNSATMRIKTIVSDLGLCPASSRHASPDAQQANPAGDKWGDLLGVVG